MKVKTILKDAGKVLAIIAAIPLVLYGMVFTLSIANATPSPKYFVCKYVGTPGVDETLQTGNNPISVSGNALTPPIVIGASFNDAQGRSVVVAEDTGQDEPSCAVPENPPVDVCDNLDGVQTTVPQGFRLEGKNCLENDGDPADEEDLCPAPKVVLNERCVDAPVVENTTPTPVVDEEVEVFQGK